MDELQLIIQHTAELLSNSSGELSARLKQRLNLLLKSQGHNVLDEAKFGCRKFTDFLQGPLGDHVKLDWPVGAGDVRVTLRHDVFPARHKPASREGRSTLDRSTALRSDVWQAFTNPDNNRKRFYNRVTHFIEIVQIPVEVHKAWMGEFLDLAGFSDNERAPLQALLDSTYSSDVNAAFTRALGNREQQWRQMRTLKISEKVQAWAVEHNISPDKLSNKPVPASASASDHPAATAGSILTPRQQAIRLLELMSDEDILTSAIPVLLNSVLSKSKF
jgi:hypothetical protein